MPTSTTYQKWRHLAPSIFYVSLAGLGLIWLQTGNTWYAKVVPFFDSLSYQNFTETIVRAYHSNGWGNVIPVTLGGVSINGILYKVVIAILAPVLPISRTTLYIYLIPLHLITLAALFNFLHRKTDSLALAFLGPFLYLSATPFRRLLFGVLDQRLDFATASFALLLWLSAVDWAENSSSTKKSLTFGLIAALALLHRPIMGVQVSLAIFMLVGYAIWIGWRESNFTFSGFLRRLSPAVLVVLVLFLPWLLFNARDFYNYYTVNSYDVGGISLKQGILVYLGFLVNYLGAPLILLIIMLSIIAFILRTLSWKYLFLVAGLVLLPLVPLMVAGSTNGAVSQISLAGIGLIPLIFVPKSRFSSAVPITFTLIALVIAMWNLTILVREVSNIDVKDRRRAEEVLLELNEKYSIEQSPTYLSGFVLAGGGPAALSSIAQLDLGVPLYRGIEPYHPRQFGLPPKETSFSNKELDPAIICTLNSIYQRGGILMLVEPSQVGEYQSVLTRPFSHQITARIDKLALESGRLEDSGITATLSGIPVRFYRIVPGEFPAKLKCNQ